MRLSNSDGLRALNLYHNLFYFAKKREVGSEWLTNCEELVGVTHRRWWGWF